VVERTANAVICTVPPAGLVAGNAEVVRGLVAEIAPGQTAVVDLVRAADTVDGDGLAALLELIAAVRRAGGRVAIAARGNLARRLRFVGVERLAPVCDSAALALVAVRAR
jgi:anti-anti-sigma regulatory factor